MKHLLLICLITSGIAVNAQFYVGAGAGGTTRGKLAAELQLGYNFKFLLLQTGFITHTNNTRPAVFQFKTGHEFRFGDQALTVSGGYAYQLMSTAYKNRNESSYITGIEYTKYIREGAAFYTGINKSGEYTFITVGLKYMFTRE